MQGEKIRAGAPQGRVEADSGTETVGLTVNGASILVWQPGQVVVPAESRTDVSTHGFWKWGTITMFNMRFVNLDAGSYLRMTPEKALVKARENKYLYLQAYLERRINFTPMVYLADGITGAEALAAQKRLAALLSYKLKWEYSEMCGFVWARMSQAIVRSNSLLLCGPRKKGARTRQRPELTYGVLMSLLAPWRG